MWRRGFETAGVRWSPRQVPYLDDRRGYAMPELRKDPVIGRWVIIAVERAKRPQAFVRPPEERKSGFCPFCPGNESLTPPEVLAYRHPGTERDAPGWWLRCVPNKFPALECDGQIRRQGDGMYDKMNGIGAHEVVIETTEHNASMADYTQAQTEEILWAYRDRILELRKDSRFRYVIIFKNHGRQAGASLDHPHSQVIALPIVPKRVQEEILGSQRHYEYKDRCVFCDMLDQETKDRARLVEENSQFVAFEPFASRFPFETWVLPRRHESHFCSIDKDGVGSLAEILGRTLRRIKQVLNDPPYNYIIHTSPFDEGPLPHYHWHIEIIPKLTQVAGFEWGTGFYINPTPPEQAAQFLQQVRLDSEIAGNPAEASEDDLAGRLAIH